MGIADDDIVHVRQSSDIVAVISEHVALKRVGRRWQGLCPFHAEKSPSFSVNQEDGLYYCFGCGAKGDVITMKWQKVLPQTVSLSAPSNETLAKELGISVEDVVAFKADKAAKELAAKEAAKSAPQS